MQDIVDNDGSAVQVVDGDVEEPGVLSVVQVHRDDVVCSGRG